MAEMIELTVKVPRVPGHLYTGEFRIANMGETVLLGNGDPYVMLRDGDAYDLILEKIECPVPDGILKPGWIAMDDDGFWYWFEDKPILEDGEWAGGVARGLNALLNIDWPDISAEDSLFEVK